MMDRWLFHWPHSVWKIPDAFTALPVLLMCMIRAGGTLRPGAQEADVSLPREPIQVTHDYHHAGTICDVLSTPHPPLTETLTELQPGSKEAASLLSSLFSVESFSA